MSLVNHQAPASFLTERPIIVRGLKFLRYVVIVESGQFDYGMLEGFSSAQSESNPHKWERASKVAEEAVHFIVALFCILLVPAGFYAVISFQHHNYLGFGLAVGVLGLAAVLLIASQVVFKLEERGWWKELLSEIAHPTPVFDWDSFERQFEDHVNNC